MTSPNRPERLQSLDILRGFDMFWITWGHYLVAALSTATGWKWLEAVEGQMHPLHGCPGSHSFLIHT